MTTLGGRVDSFRIVWAQAADESSGWPLRSRHARQVVSRTAYVALLGFLLHEAQLHITGDMTASAIWARALG